MLKRRAGPVVTLLTDFGLGDPYVAAMKGVLLTRAPGAVLVDITHDVPAYSISAGAYLLEQSVRTFPEHSVHLVVVDPGVGSDRDALLVQTRARYFIGPRNGVLDRALLHAEITGAWTLRPGAGPVSPTFHGRDFLAPVAGDLVAGRDIFGYVIKEVTSSLVSDLVALRRSVPYPRAAVLWIDRFGNVVLDLTPADLPRGVRPEALAARAGRGEVRGFNQAYHEGSRTDPYFLIGSGGHIEISLTEASAARALGLSIGDPVSFMEGSAS